jgi:integrase
MSEVWGAYEEMQNGPRDTVGWMLSLYTDSQQFAKLKDKTKSDYLKAIDIMKSRKIGAMSFGDAPLSSVTKRTVRGYLDSYPSPVAANRHIAVLKAAWSWTEERHVIPENPCLGVKMNEEKPRQRYVTDQELDTVLAMAPEEIAQMMQLAYLLRARLGEVLALSTSDVSDTHVTLDRVKGSEGELTMLSERLRDAVSKVRGGDYIVHRYSESGFRSAWKRLQGKMDAAGIERFTFHDLKAKGISDHKDNFGGHRSPNMRKVYVRKLQEIEATA